MERFEKKGGAPFLDIYLSHVSILYCVPDDGLMTKYVVNV
jgi:hypothetical protein